MRKLFILKILSLSFVFLQAQEKQPSPLLKSWPVTVTPLSFWDSDISASVGGEYRFHHSISTKTSADYIYGDYGLYENSKTAGFRLRQELRYYILGNKIMNSRSRVWPYVGIARGIKRVTTTINRWESAQGADNTYSTWTQNEAINREWFLQGRGGMQTAFGREKRFLFDFSFGVGASNNKVKSASNVEPRLRNLNELFWPDTGTSGSDNLRSGKFTSVNFEACFGYRL